MSIVFPCEVKISGDIANATIGQDAVITLDYGATADRKVVLDQSVYIKKSDDTVLTNLFDAGLNITNSAMNGVNIDDTTNKTSLGSDTLDFTNTDGSILYTRLQQLNLQFTATNKNTN